MEEEEEEEEEVEEEETDMIPLHVPEIIASCLFTRPRHETRFRNTQERDNE